MKRVLAGLIVSGIILTGGTGQVYAQEVEKNDHEKVSVENEAQFSLENNGDSSGTLTLKNASFRQDGGKTEIVDASGRVLETLPELSKNDGKIVRYDYAIDSNGKANVSAELSPEGTYGWVRCVTGVTGAAIVGGIGGAAAGGSAGSVLPGAGTAVGAVGYGTASAIGSGAAAGAGVC